MTDSAYVLDYLERHPRGADAMEIISASIRDRGVGLTCHSRISDLRAQGYTITCQIEGKTRRGRERYVYRLVAEPEAATVPAVPEPSVEPLTQLELVWRTVSCRRRSSRSGLV